MDYVSFLGCVIESRQLKTDPQKIQAVAGWPIFTSRKQLQQFLQFSTGGSSETTAGLYPELASPPCQAPSPGPLRQTQPLPNSRSSSPWPRSIHLTGLESQSVFWLSPPDQQTNGPGQPRPGGSASLCSGLQPLLLEQSPQLD